MKKKIFIVLASAVFVGFTGLALAQETEDTVSDFREKNEQKREEIKKRIEERKQRLLEIKEKRQEMKVEKVKNREEKKEERQEGNCKNVEKQIQNRINRYGNSHDRHVKILNNMEEKLARIISRFEIRDLDVSELRADAKTLSDMIDSVVATHQAFLSALKESENYACSESDDEFKNKLGESRRILPEVKEGIEDIREYYKDTIRPDLLELRRQLGENDNDETENEDNE